MKISIDDEYDILTAVADYVVDDKSNKYPLTGDEIINFTSILAEFSKLDILDISSI